MNIKFSSKNVNIILKGGKVHIIFIIDVVLSPALVLHAPRPVYCAKASPIYLLEINILIIIIFHQATL